MKKFLLTMLLSLNLLEAPLWGAWYKVDDSNFEIEDDDEEGFPTTITVKNRDIDIYFKTTKGSKVLKGTDVEDKVSAIEDLLSGKTSFNINFIKPSTQKHWNLMELTLRRFEHDYENLHCKEAIPVIQDAWDRLYQQTKNRLDQDEEERQERHRAKREEYENFLESNGPTVQIMKDLGYFSDSDSE